MLISIKQSAFEICTNCDCCFEIQSYSIEDSGSRETTCADCLAVIEAENINLAELIEAENGYIEC